MTNKAEQKILGEEERRKALEEAFNNAKDLLSDYDVWSPDQIYQLCTALDFIREAILCRPIR